MNQLPNQLPNQSILPVQQSITNFKKYSRAKQIYQPIYPILLAAAIFRPAT